MSASRARNLIVILGDQLDRTSASLDGFDPASDAIIMTEAVEEASYVPQHRQRLTLFFSAMRHFRAELEAEGLPLHYGELEDPANEGSLAGELERRVRELEPERVIVTQPGDYRVLEALRASAAALDVPLEVRDDRHFLDELDRFEDYASGRKELVLEMYYRQLRKRLDVLMDGKKPVSGRWNFDQDNRQSLPRRGGPTVREPLAFEADAITREVRAMVDRRFPDAPGNLDGFAYPVSREQSLAALQDFIEHRLPHFGHYQDAMATGAPFLFHSLLSAPLNLHMLDPREVIEAAIAAYEAEHAPLNAVEGFVRQVLGWREYVRGIYWWRMPAYADMNELEADLPMPAFMWDADTDMNCIRQSVGQLVDHAYAHHIQRLMVLGLFSMLLGVRPYDVHRWHMSMYIDAVDWVSLPNVLGMSQYGDGGVVGSKPYCASGSYINRMSDYCKGCRYEPGVARGDDACPITTLYWDFLDRHRARLADNRRMGFQYKNLSRKSPDEVRDIRRRAQAIKVEFTARSYL